MAFSRWAGSATSVARPIVMEVIWFPVGEVSLCVDTGTEATNGRSGSSPRSAR